MQVNAVVAHRASLRLTGLQRRESVNSVFRLSAAESNAKLFMRAGTLQAKRQLPKEINPLDQLVMTRKQLYQKYVKGKQRQG